MVFLTTMDKIQYIRFEDINPSDLILILNEQKVRDHLVLHPTFDSNNVNEWVKNKIDCNSKSGCRTRVITEKNNLVGWCGIQQDNDGYEIAIVLSKSCWGLGPLIFKDLLLWAKELGHIEVVIHLLETRPEYRFLKRISTRVSKTKMLNRVFTTYHIPVKT